MLCMICYAMLRYAMLQDLLTSTAAVSEHFVSGVPAGVPVGLVPQSPKRCSKCSDNYYTVPSITTNSI